MVSENAMSLKEKVREKFNEAKAWLYPKARISASEFRSERIPLAPINFFPAGLSGKNHLDRSA
jgi:hypothetical protein